MKPIIIVHGGAGDIPKSRVHGKLDGVKLAVTAGYQVLTSSGSALDAVEAAVVSMEKDENFNAGGEGAKLFALSKGFEMVPSESLISENAKNALKKFLEHGEFGRTEIGPLDESGVGTVGAVAIDSEGRVAVATSTGGMSGKAVGRIGDTPQIGSGTYADDNIGGVSTTGHGESILKYCLAHRIVRIMEGGVDANTATRDAVNGMTKRLNNTAGAVTLSKSGDVGVYFSSKRMSWAYIKDNKIFYGIEQETTLEEPYFPKS